MEAAYVHLPFCQSICSYCDFCKVLYKSEWVTQYLNALAKEIKDRYEKEPLKTIYIGGGTPSFLKPKELHYFFEILNYLEVLDGVEITFECNLNDIHESLLELLKANGVTRLSIGIESFDPSNLAFMKRTHTYHEAQEKIELCRRYGFQNINLDLIYGIPGETLSMLKKDLALFLKLNPEHISTYSLIHEDHTLISTQGSLPIDEDLDAEMYDMIVKKLQQKKYHHYEVSNFSKPGFESKHNLTYWNNDEYYGFGLGAAGYFHGVRYQNTRSLTDYFKGKTTLQEEFLSAQDMMDHELMLGLRKVEGISLESFFNRYGVNMQDSYPLKPLLKNKDLVYKDGYILIHSDKLYVMNEILIKLI